MAAQRLSATNNPQNRRSSLPFLSYNWHIALHTARLQLFTAHKTFSPTARYLSCFSTLESPKQAVSRWHRAMRRSGSGVHGVWERRPTVFCEPRDGGPGLSAVCNNTQGSTPHDTDTPSGLAAVMHNLPTRKLRFSADPLFAQVPKDRKSRYLSSWFISPSTLKLHLNKRLLGKRC